MRSGSTLLKALLGEAPDISRLREVDFQRFADNRKATSDLWKLAPEKILLLKKPAWFHEVRTYPRLPNVEPQRLILLVRDVCTTVKSLRKMMLGKLAGYVPAAVDRWLVTRYWLPVTKRLLELSRQREYSKLIRYEDLVERPIEVTADLFRFLGSSRSEGTDTYREPAIGRWRWWVDDNSHNIRSLRVQAPRTRLAPNLRLAEFVESHSELQETRRQLGYA